MDNNNNPKKEPNYITTGAIIGASQTVFGHPIDTLKTLYQNKNSKVIEKIYHESIRQDIRNKKPKFGVISRLYAGVSYPLIINLLYNTVVYELHNKIYQKTNNHFTSGFVSGSVMSVFLNPFEVGKIKQQIYYKNNKDSIKSERKLTPKNLNINHILNHGNTNCKLFVALPFTFLRESISSGVYFQTYFSLIGKINAFNAGGIAGVSSWILTYPIDTYKTRVQANSNYKMKMNIKNFKSLWNGLSFCLIRAYLVNGVGFYIYNKLTSNS